MRGKISACITCYNEEAKIRRCLASLTWCDEIVVVDSFSEDKTVDICKEFTDRVYQHEWLGYIGQKNWVREKARFDWVLFVDADEEIPAALAQEIQAVLEQGSLHYVGYRFPRQVYYLGRWIRHGAWHPDIKLRLFRRERGRSAGREPHDHVEVEGPVKTLKNPIWHYTYDDLHDHVGQINRFSSITAGEKFKEGTRFRMLDMLLRPLWRFFKGYILKRGFLEGFHGLVIGLVGAFEVAIKYAKLREFEIRRRKGQQSSATTREIRNSLN